MINSKKQNNKNKLTRGFTLIELLVTIVIFVIITGVVVVNSNKFDGSVLLNNFAYDVALTIKQAQSYGVNVKENTSGTFDTAYGIYFDTNLPAPYGDGNGDRTKFVLFNDTGGQDSYSFSGTASNPDQKFNGSLGDCATEDLECVQKFSMTKGTYVKTLCAGANELDCNDHEVSQLSILFKRPSLEAKIYINGQNAVTIPTPNNKAYAKITLSASDGSTANIVVTEVGQIYVKK